MAESFFATVKVELAHHATWETRAAARTELFEYIEVYNGQRRHSSLGYFSPGPSSGSERNDNRSLTQVSIRLGQDQVEYATAVIWKTLLVAEQSFRGLDAPERLPGVVEGVVYVDGVREKQGNEKAAA